MADATPQLKRKSEETVAQRKAKKQRMSEAAALKDARNGLESTPPSNNPTPKSDKTKKQPNLTPKPNGVSEEATITTPNISKKGKKDKKPRGQQTGDADQVEAQEDAVPGSSSTPSQKQPKNAKTSGTAVNGEAAEKALKKKEKKEKNSQNPEKWVESQLQGGWFLSADPIFSPDEKYLILANLRCLHVYAAETSLLANVLPVDGAGVLTAYALSSTKPNQVYVAGSNGVIRLWDWVTGTKIGRWEIGTSVLNMTVITHPESNEDLVYCHEVGKSHVINVRALRTKSHASQTELKQVLKTNSSVRGIQVLLQGKYVIVTSDNSMTVGKRRKASRTALQEFEYDWREFQFSKPITTVSAYFREPQESGKGKKAAQEQRDVIDIAVGEETGAILLFEDFLAAFAALESSLKGKKERKDKTDSAESLRPKRLHWHRDAVGAVKWSLDGNYIISGGDETVLTIWQLATGNPQHLPHLSAAIENIVVSPSGSSYALTLANNSVIVLSTTELEAKTNIVGIQSRRVDFEQLPKESPSGKAYLDIFHSVPMAVNPTSPNEVLFSVPSSQPRQRNEGLRPEPYLQTFDLANQRAKARQALTRNNATEPNVAPEGGRVIEPSVTLLQVSHDGEWLATVDEWVPPRADSGYLNEGIPEFNEEERLSRREVYLKIWRRDEQKSHWTLEARIDAPHFFENVCGNGKVFDLVADPTAAGFATVGEDHVVRIWKPKTRSRDGVVVRGARGEGLVTWSLDRSIEISDKLELLEGSQQSLPPRTSRLAFSADGSVLAAAISWASEADAGVTHLIDTNTAAIRRSITEIDVTELSGLGFVGQHLVVVADSITVWDMVSDQLAYSIPVKTTGIDRLERIPLVRLAVNESDGTFAVSLPLFEKNKSSESKLKKASSKLSIYTPDHDEALWTEKSRGITLALVSRRSEKGYVTLDSNSCIKSICPTSGSLQLPTPPPEENAELRRTTYGADEEEDEESARPLAALMVSDDLTQNIGDDEHIFNMQDLQNLINDGALPPPPMSMFSNVLALVGGPRR
ncbi:WD40 repeat-like protein [Clathrospora elynae]|uniref:WD40 repeat-like protein n=1 Tax=Clathrospora elynae TaxID=706981 RepID=A0A6A5T6G1_9PLEO|nr:WD40 repeat-like protein [Clathrospora elynae]